MNKNTVNELFIPARKIETAIDAIARILDSIEAILADAEREAEIRKDARTVLLGAKAMGPMKKEAKPERLPDVPDWRDTAAGKRELSDRSVKSVKRGKDGAAAFAEDDRLTRIRLTVAAHQGEKLSKIIEAVKAGEGISNSGLAALLGVHPARITEAVRGKARPGFVQIFTEILGEGADLAAKKSGKRGAK